MKNKPAIITNIELMKEWHWVKNEGMDPNIITIGSGKSAYWQCERGHIWKMTIYKRAIQGQKCPYCAGRKASPEHNLKFLFPDLVEEWDYRLNEELRPEEVTPGSNRQVYWKCPTCGGEYKAAICDRTIKKTGCPYCAGKKVISGSTDLATTHSELLDQWYWRRNDELGLFPTELGAGSHTKVWWICNNCRKPYIRAILVQVRINGRCPYCAGRRRDTSFYSYI